MGDDTLAGGLGDDWLEGGVGEDQYLFGASDGKDTIVDMDGEGTVTINGTVIGTAQGTGQADVWALKLVDGTAMELTRRTLPPEDGTAGTDSLVISRKGDSANEVRIDGFDFDAAFENGYLGIKLDPTPKLALKAGRDANPWRDPDFDPATLAGQRSEFGEQGGRYFTVYLKNPAKKGDSLMLNSSGLSQFKVDLEGTTLSVNGGMITLEEGQTEVGFLLYQEGELSADANGTLDLQYLSSGGGDPGAEPVKSNAWNVTAKDFGEAETTVNGDYLVWWGRLAMYDPPIKRGEIVVVEKGGTTFLQQVDTGNLHPGWPEHGIMVTDNVLYGTHGNDRVNGLTGNDMVYTENGNDTIDGGDGDDMIIGGNGSDSLLGGAGNDYVTSAGVRWFIDQQRGPTDDWMNWSGMPDEATLKAHGTIWGVYDLPQPEDEDLDYLRIWSGIESTLKNKDAPDYIDAGTGDDAVIASWGNDRIFGGSGKDTLDGLAGDDHIDGGDGADKIRADGITNPGYLETVDSEHHGEDYVDGGDGDDDIEGGGNADVLLGGVGNDSIWGDVGVKTDSKRAIKLEHHGDDYIDGGIGNDYLEGGAGDDTLLGGDGEDADNIWGDMPAERLASDGDNARAWGDDYLDGGKGADTLTGGGKNDTLYGGAGKDKLFGDEQSLLLKREYHGDDFLDGGEEADYLEGGGGNDTLVGGEDEGADTLWGDSAVEYLAGEGHGTDLLDGGAGDDMLGGDGSSDTLYGGQGNDTLFGDDKVSSLAAEFHGNDLILAGDGNDVAEGGAGNDSVFGGTGADYLIGDEMDTDPDDEVFGNDLLDGGADGDTLIGCAGDDSLYGGTGDDFLSGDDVLVSTGEGEEVGDDYLNGGEGTDVLLGGLGNDTLEGGAESDYLVGGQGDDTYIVGVGDVGAGLAEVIEDVGGSNTLVLKGVSFLEGLDVIESGGDLQVNLGGGAALRIVGGLNGAISTYESASGERMSYAQFLNKTLRTPRTYTSYTPNDTLAGGKGNDTLSALGGGGSLEAGEGDDVLTGAGGGNTYFYRRGDGRDTITDTGGGQGAPSSRITFGAGITSADVRVTVEKGKIVLVLSADESITLGGVNPDYLLNAPSIDQFVFDDGEVLSWAQLAARGITISGTAADDTLRGTSLGDTLDGGAGNDNLYGGGGSDVYRFGPGAGFDWIADGPGAGGDVNVVRMAAGVSASDVSVRRGWSSGSPQRGLYLDVGQNGDSVGLADFFGLDGNATSTGWRVEFDDGTAWSVADLLAMLQAGGDGDDLLVGGTGDDVLDGGGGDDHLDGKSGNDTLRGGEGRDTLEGGDGDDLMDGGPGDDSMIGWAGRDTYAFNRGGGRDTVRMIATGGVDDILVGEGISPDDVLIDATGTEISIRGTQDRISFIDMFDAQGQPRIGEVRFANGEVWTWQALRDLAKPVADRNRLEGGPGDDLLVKQRYSQELYGLGGNDTLLAVGGGTLHGGDGDDVLEVRPESSPTGSTFAVGRYDGGAGSDTFMVDPVAHIKITEKDPTEGSIDRVVLTQAIDPASMYYRIDGGDLTVYWKAPQALSLDEHPGLVLQGFFDADGGASVIDEIRFSDSVTWSWEQLRDAALASVSAAPSEGDDVLIGTGWHDTVHGLGGHDRIEGLGGNDEVYGGAGNDSLLGGDGDDRLFGFKAPSSPSSGDDFVHGGAGRDFLSGGDGDDTYYYERGDGIDQIWDGNGFDTLRLGPGITPADVTLQAWSAIGSSAIDMLVSINDGSGGIHVTGFPGSVARPLHIDRIVFDSGVVWDVAQMQGLVQPAGTMNTQTGSPGDDVFVVDHAGDQIVEKSGEGMDRADSSVSYVLPVNVENLTLTGTLPSDGKGNAGNNLIVGNAASNHLWGDQSSGTKASWQSDTLVGGAGDDVYYVSSYKQGVQIIEQVGEGEDWVDLSRALEGLWSFTPGTIKHFDYTLPDNVEHLRMGDSRIWSVRRKATGNTLDNLIIGDGAGGTVFDGVSGADTLVGGAQNDVYIVNSADDVVRDTGSTDTDEVRSSVDFTLGDNLENLTLTGSTATTGTGNALDNVLDGAQNAAANTLRGGKGDDRYIVDALDVVVEDADGGVDTVEIGAGGVATYRLADFAHIENLALGNGVGASSAEGDAAANILGGNDHNNLLAGLEGDDSINGGAGNDTLRGGAGNDWLEGGHGADLVEGGDGDDHLFAEFGTDADTLKGGAGDDVYHLSRLDGHEVVELAGEGIDEIRSSGWIESYNLADNVEHLWASDAQVLIGNDLANRMEAGNGDNRLEGAAGDDTLIAGAGADTLYGGAGDDLLRGGDGADVYLFGIGDGHDTIENIDDDARDVQADRVLIGAGVAVDAVEWHREGNDLVMTIAASGDTLRIRDYLAYDGDTRNAVETIAFTDGDVSLTPADVLLRLSGGGTNRPPVAGTTLDAQDAKQGEAWLYALPEDSFSDPDTGDVLSYSATLADGSALPGWLVFDAARREFSGTPAELDADGVQVRVTATDAAGASVAQEFTLRVTAPTPSLNPVTGTDAGERLDGTVADDLLRGLAGDDYLMGDVGNDQLDGGAGNDWLIGGAGDDVYVYRQGDGWDTVVNLDVGQGRSDTLRLEDIDESGVQVSRSGADLIVSIVGRDEGVIVSQHFSDEDTHAHRIDRIEFADGTVWDAATIAQRAGGSDDGNDILHAPAEGATLNGGAGNDLLYGNVGADILEGGSGDDYLLGDGSDDILRGGTGNDWLEGGDGNDVLYGDEGSDVLIGNTGADYLAGGAGNDVLQGDAGNDWLEGGAGDDIYVFGRYHGWDTINAQDASDTSIDTLRLTEINETDLRIRRVGVNLILEVIGSDAGITVSHHFYTGGTSGTAYQLDRIEFADGAVWDAAEIALRAMSGTDGNDELYAPDGGATLSGGTGNDVLYGGAGDDVLEGGADGDWLEGGAGNDVYRYGRGDGGDVINNYDTTAGRDDRLLLGDDIGAEQIWLRQSGNDLEIHLIGTQDLIMVSNWYADSAFQLDAIELSSGERLLNSRVQSLVEAMAAFAPPGAGQTTLPPDYAAALNPAIAANWQ